MKPDNGARDVLTGNCLCGQVRYEVYGRLGPFFFCHCKTCQKAQGGAFVCSATVQADNFKLVAGSASVAEYESSPGKKRCFCRNCGSPLWSRRDADARTLRVRLGLLNGDPGQRALGHIFIEDQAPWFDITDDLPQGKGFELMEKLERS
jgi:hypothetical protein